MDTEDMQAELQALRLENMKLKEQLAKSDKTQSDLPMSLDEFKRYGRQLIVEDLGGVKGQVKLRNAKILVVGAGGLGCPALQYLAAAGIGKIGIVDDDTVDASNLHRQVLHRTTKVGMLKVDSAKEAIAELNPYVKVVTYPMRLASSNAFEIFSGYDVILDCTDAPLPRYLISDVAVNLGITVVSASGLRTDGQLSIYNFKGVGPCYRCFYPDPPAPGSVTSCQAGGVIGPCIGLMGVMMAVETLKILLDIYTVANFTPFMMQYAGFPQQTLRTFKMRSRKSSCLACGEEPTITRKSITAGDVDYSVFCSPRNFDVCQPDERITVQDFEANYRKSADKKHLVLDVRPRLHYQISHLPGTHNIALKELEAMAGNKDELLKRIPDIDSQQEVLIMCRHGNESRLALRILKDNFNIKNTKDIIGGYYKYIDDINPSLPKF